MTAWFVEVRVQTIEQKQACFRGQNDYQPLMSKALSKLQSESNVTALHNPRKCGKKRSSTH